MTFRTLPLILSINQTTETASINAMFIVTDSQKKVRLLTASSKQTHAKKKLCKWCLKRVETHWYGTSVYFNRDRNRVVVWSAEQ